MIGSVLRARYEITRSISETPLFKVFAAFDRLQGREVCVRVLRTPFSEERDFVHRLSEVVSSLTAVQHPNLETIYAMDGDDDAPFLVTEYSKGGPLGERLRRLGTFSVPSAVSTAITICEGLQALHSQRQAHGDVGAHTVCVNADGDVKLQCFGIWRAYSASASAGVAVLPQMAHYLAPEISRGSMPSAQSDVYAVGVLMYELLAGRVPFHAENTAALAVKHLNEAPPNVRMMNPSVPIVLAEIIRKCMSKDVPQRYQDAGDLLSDLRILQDSLRFGRTLSWPIREVELSKKPDPVAPKMGAIRTPARPQPKPAPAEPSDEPSEDPKPKKAKKAPREREVDLYEPDVPTWLKTAIAFVAGLFVVVILAWIWLNLTKPKAVKVPDVRRLSFSEATSRLAERGLKVRVGRRLVSETIPAEQVISSSPAQGDKTFEGSSVTVNVSLGSQYVQVPDIKGETIDKARALLSSVGLQLSGQVEEEDSKEAKGTILSQTPSKGSKAARMSEVKVKVSTGQEKKAGSRRDNAKYILEISVKLSDITDPVRLRVDVEDARGTRTVHDRMHDPDEEVPITVESFGPTATFRIYYDGNLVKTEVAKSEEEEGGQQQ